MRVYAYFWPFKGAAVSRAHDSRPCALCLFERAGAYVSCLRFSVYAVPIYFLIILAMHGHTSAKFYIIKSMSTCACRQQKLHRLIQTHTITQTRVRNPLSLCRESAPFCALHRLLKEKHCTGTFKTYTVTQTSKRKSFLCADNLQFCRPAE